MRSTDPLLRTSDIVLRVLSIGNYASGVAFVVMLVFGIALPGVIDARLTAKYGPDVDIAAALTILSAALVAGLIAVWAVARVFRALRAIIASVRQDEAFSTANAARLRTIGWMLLVLQILDLGGGLVAWGLSQLGVDYLDWTPSFTGWLAVLVAFILARVFATGAAMREELDGTV